jgi:hypothetical protein
MPPKKNGGADALTRLQDSVLSAMRFVGLRFGPKLKKSKGRRSAPLRKS